MMSDLLSGPHGFHSAAQQARRQSDLPLASAYPQVWPVSLMAKTPDDTTEVMSLTSADGY